MLEFHNKYPQLVPENKLFLHNYLGLFGPHVKSMKNIENPWEALIWRWEGKLVVSKNTYRLGISAIFSLFLGFFHSIARRK